MSVEEAGRYLGVGRSSAYAAARRGELPIVRLGARVLVSTAGLRRLLEVDDVPTPEAQGRLA